MKLLVVDNSTPRPYTADSIDKEGMGGTEASVIRALVGLEKRGHDAAVILHCTDNSVLFGNGAAAISSPDIVIHLRTVTTLPAYRESFPEAKHAVWWHDLFNRANILDLPVLEEFSPHNLFVSRFALTQGFRVLHALGGTGNYGPVAVVPNQVETHGIRRVWDGRPTFLYASSPHKGLARTVEMFKAAGIGGGELWVANPGYMELPNIPGVKVLGTLTHRALIEEMAKAAAVVGFGTQIPETHGIVFAEAARLSVPVITHKHGAPIEYLLPGQLIDCNSQEEVTNALACAAAGTLPSGAKEMPTNESIISKLEKALLNLIGGGNE